MTPTFVLESGAAETEFPESTHNNITTKLNVKKAKSTPH